MNKFKEVNIYYFIQPKKVAQNVRSQVFEYQQEEDKQAYYAKVEQIIQEVFLRSQNLIGKK